MRVVKDGEHQGEATESREESVLELRWSGWKDSHRAVSEKLNEAPSKEVQGTSVPRTEWESTKTLRHLPSPRSGGYSLPLYTFLSP